MNLKALLKEIGEIAINEKLVNFSAAGGSIDQLNPISIDHYPVLFQTPAGEHQVKENTTVYRIVLTYIDRLLEDSSNEIDIYSTSIEELKNIINWIKEIPEVVNVSDEYPIRNFTVTEKMNDRVCGSYAEIMVEVMNETLCPVE